MIDTSTVGKTDVKEFAPDDPRFRVEPPPADSLVAASTAALSRQANQVTVEWTTPSGSEAQGAKAEQFLAGVIDRARRYAARFPHSARAHANLGLALLKDGRIDEAAESLERALAVEPNNYIASMALANIRRDQSRFDDAVELYRGLAATYPETAEPLVGLGYIALWRNELKEAAELLQQALSLDPASVLPHYLLAIALFRLRHPREATRHLRAATRSDVRSPAAHHALGVAYAVSGDLRRAARAFKTALTLMPGMSEAARGLGKVLLQQGRAEKAIDVLADYLSRRPEDYEARELLARAYWERSDYRAARQELVRTLRSLDEHSNVDARFRASVTNNIGASLAAVKDLDSAAEWYLKAIQFAPGASAAPYHNLARLYLERDAPQEACDLLRSYLAYAPANTETQRLYALSLYSATRKEEAIRELSQLLSRGDEHQDNFALLSAILVDDEKDLDGALHILQKGRRRHPRNTTLTNNLAYVYLMRGEPAAAREILESISKSPDAVLADPVLRATWGLLLLWEGDIEGGKRGYAEAERIARRMGQSVLARVIMQKGHLELAQAYLRLGDRERALSEVERGLRVRLGRKSYETDLESLRRLLHLAIPPR